MRFKIFLGVALIVWGAVFWCGDASAGTEICNRVVAVVNEELITLYELNRKIQEMTGLSPDELKERDRKAYIQTRKQVLELLINEKLAQEKIKQLGIKVSPEEVDAAIEKVKQDNQLTHEDLLATLKSQGLTYEKYRESIKKELERLKLINYEVKSKIIIREEEVRNFYQENLDRFKVKDKVRLAMIFIPFEGRDKERARKKVQEILERLKKGEDFASLARQFSKGPNAQKGGDLGLFKWEELDPAIRKLVEKLPEGEITPPIVRPGGIKLIKVVRRYDSGVRPFDEVKDAIYAELYRQEVNRRYEAWLKELREKAYTKIIF